MLSVTGLNDTGGLQFEAEPNDTLTQAQGLGDLTTQARTDVAGGTLTTGSGPDTIGHALSVAHRDRPDLPQIVLVGLARRRDHPRFSGQRHLHRDEIIHAIDGAEKEVGRDAGTGG